MSKMLIVSNHSNHDLEWLKMTYNFEFSPKNTLIYDRTPDNFPNKSRIDYLGKVVKSPNVGSNLYDIGRYVVENYDNLPDMVIFIKGNLLQKGYTTKERFLYALNSNWFVPIDRGTHISHIPLPFVTNDNWFSLPMNSEIQNKSVLFLGPIESIKVYPRIRNFGEFIKDLFIIEEKNFPDFISFAPAANYAVPKNVILKYSKNFYKKMMFYTDYNNNPIEAHWFERVLQLAWQGCLEENFSYIVE